MKHWALISVSTFILASCGGEGDQIVEPQSQQSAELPVSQVSKGSGQERPDDGTNTKTGGDNSYGMDRAVKQAVDTGDVSHIKTAAPILNALDTVLERNKRKFRAAKADIFQLSRDGSLTPDSLTQISWDPTHDTAILQPSFGSNEAILISNAVTQSTREVRNDTLGVIGEAAASRYMVLGSNPMRNARRNPASVSEDMHAFLRNSLSWLTGEDDLTQGQFNVVIAQSSQSYYFPDRKANREWLSAQYPSSLSVNDEQACDGAALAGCLTSDTDLLIISQYLNTGEDAQQITDSVKAAMARGTPVLYMHYDGNNGELAQSLFPLFNVNYAADNYWRRQSIEAFDPQDGFGELPEDVESVRALLKRLPIDDFSFSLAECDNHSCPDGSTYYSEFKAPAQVLKTQFQNLDKSKTRIFENPGYEYEKLTILLADIYRRDARFPMDKTSTPRAQFLTSLLADHIVYNSRMIAPVQKNMGNFSRSDFSHVEPISRRISLISKPNFRSTGAYALPGQSFKVTRTDNNDVDTQIFINTLRSGATHEFENNGYKRPKYLKSQSIALLPGEPLILTSTYGGPIQISFSDKDIPVELSFETIGQHPYWDGPEDDTAFTAAVAAADYDWAELVTAGFEVHSKIEKMQSSLEDEKWGNAAAIAAGAERYMSNLPHVLAGFKGPGIDVVAEIHDFADARGIEIETLDKVKHMNADQATCGYGCSGNPYDAYWSYDPLGHGDIHELGHGLEKSRFRFTGWEGHAVTNPYSYYAKTKYGAETGADLDTISCQSLAYEEMFARVQTSRSQADPFAYMQAQNTGNWKDSVTIMTQLYMAAQAEGVLENGWHLLARLHVIERAFNTADNNDSNWLAARAGLGFDGYSRDEARNMGNDDWMLIALSYASERDVTDFLTTWGLGASDMAKAHVAAMNLPKMPVQFFLANDDDFCLGLDKTPVPIDGAQLWPF